MAKTKRIIVLVGSAVLMLVLVACVGLAGTFWWHGRGVSSIDEARLRDYRPPQVTRILARDGRVIGELFRERRTFVEYEKIPSQVENAFLAAEDADFYRHEGLDVLGMVRALFANLRAGGIRQGASTITQQVVKTFMLSPERTIERKVQELILARRLEQALEKREILELYLNEIYLGHGAYGVEEASRLYFGKSVAEVDLGQAAVLAGLPKAPSRDSPFKNPKGAKKRQVYVLQQMVKHGFVGARDAQHFISAPLALAEHKDAPRVVSGAEEFVAAVRDELERRYGAGKLETLGATVVTTVDLELQAAAHKAVRDGLIALDERQAYGHGIRPAKAANQQRALAKGRERLAIGAVVPAVISARPAGANWAREGFVAQIGDRTAFVRVASRYREGDRSIDEQFPEGGITMVKVVSLEPAADRKLPEAWIEGVVASGPEAAFLLADVVSGEVLAMIGGADYRLGGFNRAVQAKRQPGSAFKPFVYGAALQSKRFTAATRVSDSPEIYEKWRPTNFEPDVYRGEIRLREALTHSVNTIAIKLLDAVGVQAVHAFARAAGIESPLVDNLSLALGTSELSVWELLRANLTLARGGSRVEPALIREIHVPGAAPWVASPAAVDAIAPDVVFVLTSLLTSVVQEGTGSQAKVLGVPAAGKTGTSAEHKDAWFAGFTRDRVAVAWVGFDQPRALGRGETGGRAALPIWIEAMRAAVDVKAAKAFVAPPSISVRTIDKASGLLAPPGVAAPVGTTMSEYFLAGTEPVDEAVPQAIPAGEVLLDLYGQGTAGRSDEEAMADQPQGDALVEPALPSVDSP